MREIKFRAWINAQKRYAEAVDIGDIPNHWSMPAHWAVIEQYTGLKDRNGKEIYEGDLLAVSMGGDPQTNPSVVEWDEVGWSPWLDGLSDNYYAITSCEVIGNIHESPELLK